MHKLLTAIFTAPAVLATADALTLPTITEPQVAMLAALWGCAVLGGWAISK